MKLEWDCHWNLLVAETLQDALSIAHPSGPRQVGVWQEDGLCVFDITTSAACLTHAPDHWGLPAWHAKEGSENVRCSVT